jgi:hypothetical protein
MKFGVMSTGVAPRLAIISLVRSMAKSVTWVLVLAFAHTAQAASVIAPLPSPIVIPVPCANPSPNPSSSPPPGLRSCSDVLNGSAAVPAVPVPIPSMPGIISMIRQRMQTQADCAYRGVDFDPRVVAQSNGCGGDPINPPCTLWGNSLNNYAPDCGVPSQGVVLTNRLGGTCGAPMPIIDDHIGDCSQTNAQIPAPVASTLALPPYNVQPPVQVTIDSMTPTELQNLMNQIQATNPSLLIQLNNEAGKGTQSFCIRFADNPNGVSLERAYVSGIFAENMAHYTDAEIQSIQSSNSITINNAVQSNASGTAQSGCAALAMDLVHYTNATQTQMASIQTQLTAGSKGAQLNLNDIVNCGRSWDTSGSSGTLDVGQLRQSAQQLCAARTGLESAFVQLAVCDILQKSQSDFLNMTGYPNTQVFFNNLHNVIDDDCRNPTTQSGVSGANCKSSGSYGSLKTCLNRCYPKALRNEMLKFYQSPSLPVSPWPWQPSTTPPSNSCPQLPLTSNHGGPSGDPAGTNPWLGLAMMAGSLGNIRKKRGKKTSSDRSFSGRFRNKLALLFFVLCAAFVSACSSSVQNLPSTPVAPPLSTMCPSGGPQPCNPPGTGGTGATLAAGAGALSGSSGALATAGSLTGNGNGLSTASNATTGGGLGGASQTPTLAATTTGSLGAIPTLSAASAAGNATMGSGGSSGNPAGSVNSNGSVSMATPGPDAEPSSPPGGSLNGGTMGGSGGGAQSANAKNSGFLFGNGLMADSGIDGANGENKFGNQQEIPAMKGEDPANYFSMINIEDNIFETVKRRYQAKSMDWAGASMQDLAGASTSIKVQNQK